jgi:outer membrane protein TolC
MRAVLAILLLFGVSHAATIEEVVAQAMRNNPTLQSFTLRAEKFALEAKREGLWSDPVLGAGINDIQFERPFERDLEPMQTHALTLSRQIPTNGKLALKSAIPDQSRKITLLKRDAYKRMLRAKVLELSYRYIIMHKKAQIVKKRIANLQKMHHVLTYLYESSKIARPELLRNSSRIAQNRLTLQNLRYRKQEALLELEKLTFTPVKRLSDNLRLPEVSLDINQSIQHHPALTALKEQIIRNKKRIALQEARRTPDVKVGVGYYQRDGRPDYMSVNFSMPLKIGGEERIARQTYLTEEKILRLKLKNLRYTMQKEAQNLLLSLRTARQNLSVIDRRLLPLSRKLEKLFRLYARTRDSHTLKIYQNRDDYLKLQLRKLDETLRLFTAISKLSYYKD